MTTKTISLDLHGPIQPPNLLRYDRMIRRYVDERREDGAFGIVETAGTMRLRDRLTRLNIELVSMRGDEALRPFIGLGGTLVAPGRKTLIWIDSAAQDSPAALADRFFHEAIHATGRVLRSHEFLPDDTLHPQEHVAEEIVALRGANLIARFVGIDIGPLAHHNRQQATRHARHLLGNGWECHQLSELKRQGHHAALLLADERYEGMFHASLQMNNAP
ncbi:hypothetical protein SAMN02799636_04954 [Methylobacterium sp. 275MFSha3.1]|uniref:hypothetical protein n=1 Tax=Methylobacterium sp. 275MFSha3.1 TaxID=1502746 RepID=UPI0008A7F89E|nr:hypothetical protein [Methylobacterium sp. 275MFSha3.1]SEI01650.1 hypothetical protein SAMN02799636_04954 [Methylobacterium sp. 275MFSha3.1]